MEQQKLISSARIRKIMLTVMVGFISLILYFTIWSYRHAINQAETASLMRLAGIANSLALQIDGDAHQKLMQLYPVKNAINTREQDSSYLSIHQLLARNYQANMLKTPVYTIIYDSLAKNYAFGVTSSEQPYFRHTYNSAPKLLMEKQSEGAMIPMYDDEFGMWLSAFAAIKNKEGKVVAMVQADEKFDLFLARERSGIVKNLLFSLLISTLVFLVLIKILQTILAKEQKDKQALTAANAQIKQLDDFRKEMIANVSHDLRTPVASILGFAEILQQKQTQLSETEKNKYLNIILSESARLTNLLRGLFDLSNLESGQITLEKEPLNMSELAQDILQKYTLQAEKKNVRLFTEFKEPIALIDADVRWIDRVIQNLLDNALKYVNEGGFIQFTVFMEDNHVNFKVCNSGTPISPENLTFVFERYFKSAKREDNSTGLGLAIVKRIIELHDGTVWAEVNEDITTLRFKLPALMNKFPQ
jgi:signal transduction histidine kinase